MTTPAVHWHEGMFLRPHHFLAAHRHWQAQATLGAKLDLHHNWGIRSIDLDRDALGNNRFVVRALRARLRDGTIVSVPEETALPAIDLKPLLQARGEVTVFLAVPIVLPGRPNVSRDPAAGVRYLQGELSLEDENTGVNPQPLQFRRLNLRLLVSGDDQTGFEVLSLARIVKSGRADAAAQLDESYIPPVLALDAWPPLFSGVIQGIYDRIGKKIELLATQVLARGITFDSHGQGDPMTFAQLRELNEAYSALGVLGFIDGVHPLTAYVELARLVGQLAIFGETRRPPSLPRYDHDDLGTCFYRAKQYLDDLLDLLIEPNYKERAFVGAGLRMQVALETNWLESVWDMYIGVLSPLDPEECIRMLTRPGQLDMKIGSSDRVDTVYRMGLPGLRFTHSPHPPRALPTAPGLIYFQIRRETSEGEWNNVQKSLTLAIRLNENLVAGNIQGQRVLSIRTGGQSTTLQFTLYVVPAES
jgi:type VI secretion system protein ImpJ